MWKMRSQRVLITIRMIEAGQFYSGYTTLTEDFSFPIYALVVKIILTI